MTDALSIARDLIRCPSVTPADAGALGVLENALHAAGFTCHRVTFSEPGTAGHNRFGPDPLLDIEDESTSDASPAKNWDQSHEIEIVPPSASPPGGMHVNRGA